MRAIKSHPKRVLTVLLALAMSVPLLPGAGAAAEEVTLRLNLHKGDTFRQSMTMEQVTDQQVGGQQMLTEMVITFKTTTEVVEERDDGVRLEVTNDRIVAEIDSPQGRAKYDSDDGPRKIAPNNPADLMVAPFAAMAGTTFSYDLSNVGKISNVEGFDGLAQKMIAGMPIPEEARAMVVGMLEKQLNNQTMGQMMEANHGAYPPRPVSIGDDWEQNLSVGGMMPFELSLDYTLTDVTPATATAAMVGQVATPDDAAMEIMPGVSMQMDLKGEQEGLIVYDRQTGWVQSMKTRQSMNGRMHMPNGPDGQPFEMPMSMETTIDLETLAE